MAKIKDRDAFEETNMFGIGAPNDAYAEYFTGNSYLKPLVNPEETPMFLANATFELGCRNNWHIHHAKSGAGQELICHACGKASCQALHPVSDAHSMYQAQE